MPTSDDLIEEIITNLSNTISPRDCFVLREVLRSLVRLAEAEKISALRRDVSLSVGTLISTIRPTVS